MGFKHFGKLKKSGEEVVILGHNRSMNDVMICVPGNLPGGDAIKIRDIAQSAVAQEALYLIEHLANEKHSSGQTWMNYAIRNLSRHEKQFTLVPISEIEFADDGQRVEFMGWGKDKPEPSQLDNTVASPQSGDPVVTPAPAPPQNDAMLSLMGELVKGQQQLAEAISSLQTNVSVQNKAEKPKKKRGRPSKAEKEPKAEAKQAEPDLGDSEE